MPSPLVLIESDWNLKGVERYRHSTIYPVLIESDWNLKLIETHSLLHFGLGINRIRLEFKLFLESDALCSCFS